MVMVSVGSLFMGANDAIVARRAFFRLSSKELGFDKSFALDSDKERFTFDPLMACVRVKLVSFQVTGFIIATILVGIFINLESAANTCRVKSNELENSLRPKRLQSVTYLNSFLKL